MKKGLKAFGFMVLILIISVLGAGFYFCNLNHPRTKENSDYFQESEVYKLESIEEYFILKDAVNKYFSYCYSLYDQNSELSNKENSENLYMLLDESYINRYRLTLDNIREKFLSDADDLEINFEKVVYITNNQNMYVYFVYGNTRNKKSNEYRSLSMIVNLDTTNHTFSIIPQDYLKELNFENVHENIKISYVFGEKIKSNKNNSISSSKHQFREYVGDMFEQIRTYMLYNPHKAYDLLYDKNITYNEFEELIQKKYKEIFTLTLNDYTLKYIENKVVYECDDIHKNFKILIFNEYPTEFTFSINSL